MTEVPEEHRLKSPTTGEVLWPYIDVRLLPGIDEQMRRAGGHGSYVRVSVTEEGECQ